MVERTYKCDLCQQQEITAAPKTELIGFCTDGPNVQFRATNNADRHICIMCLEAMTRLAREVGTKLKAVYPTQR